MNLVFTMWYVTNSHSVGCASFVERTDAPTSPPHPQTVGLRVGDNTSGGMRFYKANTHFVVYTEMNPLQMVTYCYHLNDGVIHYMLREALDIEGSHSVGCASFVERTDYPTSSPTRKPAVCGWGATRALACLSTKLTHTSWCKIPPTPLYKGGITHALANISTKLTHTSWCKIIPAPLYKGGITEDSRR